MLQRGRRLLRFLKIDGQDVPVRPTPKAKVATHPDGRIRPSNQVVLDGDAHPCTRRLGERSPYTALALPRPVTLDCRNGHDATIGVGFLHLEMGSGALRRTS